MCRFVETNRGETVGGGALTGGVTQSQLFFERSNFFTNSLKNSTRSRY